MLLKQADSEDQDLKHRSSANYTSTQVPFCKIAVAGLLYKGKAHEKKLTSVVALRESSKVYLEAMYFVGKSVLEIVVLLGKFAMHRYRFDGFTLSHVEQA